MLSIHKIIFQFLTKKIKMNRTKNQTFDQSITVFTVFLTMKLLKSIVPHALFYKLMN